MKIRAVVFDVYKTLLTVTPPPMDSEAKWETLWRSTFGSEPRMSLAKFGSLCQELVVVEHASARKLGIPFPEVLWPVIVCGVIPELSSLSTPEQDEFLFRQAQLWHAIDLDKNAAGVLRRLARSGCVLGIASNAQAYTLRELNFAFAQERLSMDLFHPKLRFWSFENGFSKPDPHVFRMLTARLQSLGISAGETLMVGDRIDNDVTPAKLQGWHTWLINLTHSGPEEGTWDQLEAFLVSSQVLR